MGVMMNLPLDSNAQKKKKKLEISLFQKEEKPFNIYDFKNVNGLKYYYDEEKLKALKKLHEANKTEELFEGLKNYVKNFGVQNFYKDTRLIWRLAKLTELFEGIDEARKLYKLVLRHHHEGIDVSEIQIYFDSLNTQQTANFVPLDYYYELVEYRKSVDTLRPPRGVLLNMGRNINSRSADYAPTINISNDILIFTSQRNEISKAMEEKPNEDLFYSTKDGATWSEAEALTMVNSIYNEGSACLSADGRTLFFSRCSAPDCIGDCDIFVAYMQADSTWGRVENLGYNVNSRGWDSHPSLSHSGDTLFFASDRIGGFGLSDIYYTYKQEKGGWAPAKNLGPVINTRNNEVSPFYHPTHEVLYFSSNGQLFSFGEFDIFRVFRDSTGRWQEPRNIGPLVNGKGSEFYFTIDAKSKDIYYARSASNDLTRFDLYSFPLPMDAHPNANTTISGSLRDSLTGKPFTGIVSIIDVDNGIEVAPRYLRPDGSFEFSLINNKNYLLIIQGDEFFRIEEMFRLGGPVEMELLTVPIKSKVKFESIEFDRGEAYLKTEMYGDLNRIVNFMYDNPDFLLKISGHTDSQGSEQVNMKLSKLRAQTIRDYVVIFGGIESYRVEHDGYGSAMPVVQENTEEDQRINRRVEFEIYRPAKPIEVPKDYDPFSDF